MFIELPHRYNYMRTIPFSCYHLEAIDGVGVANNIIQDTWPVFFNPVGVILLRCRVLDCPTRTMVAHMEYPRCESRCRRMKTWVKTRRVTLSRLLWLSWLGVWQKLSDQSLVLVSGAWRKYSYGPTSTSSILERLLFLVLYQQPGRNIHRPKIVPTTTWRLKDFNRCQCSQIFRVSFQSIKFN